MTRFKSGLFIFSMLWIGFGCQQDKRHKVVQQPQDFDPTIVGSFSPQQSTFFDSTWLDTLLRAYPELVTYQSDMVKFYQNRRYAYAWFDEQGLTEQANHLYNRVINLSQDGQPDSTLYQSVLVSMMDTLQTNRNNPMVDLMLTGQYFAYSKRSYEGEVSEKQARSLDWFLPRKKLNSVEHLEAVISSKEGVFANEPIYSQYFKIKQQLVKLQQQKADTIQSKVVMPKNKVALGDSSAVILSIREKLHLWADLKTNTKSAVFDDSLKAAIMRFQHRHGMTEDGSLSEAFLKQLNMTGKQRIQQLLVNMERYRWIPVNLKEEYLVVNIPEFMLHAYRDDSLMWDMKVIVGKELKNTVIFNGNISYIVFSPYWNIPPGILQDKVLPAMRRNRGYLRQNNMEIVGYSGKTPQIRQRPGPKNSLGLVKFMFPNTYNIYLHDTPEKELFKKDFRAFSSGCVRVAEPAFLAKFLLKDQPTWTDEKIKKAMKDGKEQYVTLKNKMPVFLTYFTAWVDKHGHLNFRDDLYNRDQKLAEILFTDTPLSKK